MLDSNDSEFLSDISDDDLSLLEPISVSKKRSTNKRKWREIEQLKDKINLEKELRCYEDANYD